MKYFYICQMVVSLRMIPHLRSQKMLFGGMILLAAIYIFLIYVWYPTVAFIANINIPDEERFSKLRAEKFRNSSNLNSGFQGPTLQYCDVFNVANGEKAQCGKRFNESWEPYLEQFGLSDLQISEMTTTDDIRILRKHPVFVTAFSDNHAQAAFQNSMLTLRRLTKKFYVYDLGLNEANLATLRNLPYVSIRTFNRSMYPEHVGRDLFEYRWKPIILSEVLHEFEAMYYIDAHFWSNSSDLPLVLQRIRCQDNNSKVLGRCYYYQSLLLTEAGHSIYATTHPDMYEYLPMDLSQSRRVGMGNCGLQLVYFTKDVRSHIYKWWVLCAFEPKCMAPKGATLWCKSARHAEYRDCHRYDQSAINILLGNRNRYDHRKFIAGWRTFGL